MALTEAVGEPTPATSPDPRKWDVIDTLRREHSLSAYAQILTPSTGEDMHGRPELTRFGSVTTLRYATDLQRRSRDDARDLPTIDVLEATLRAHPVCAEIVFVDSWHSYDDTVRTLDMALAMLSDGGFVVVHDCDPPDAQTATADPEHYVWCGVTWRGFVDVTASLPATAEWWVLESDFGVGVIRVQRPSFRQRLTRATQRRRPDRGQFGRATRPWSGLSRRVPGGHDEAWAWFVEHRVEALHPVSIETWLDRVARPTPLHRAGTSVPQRGDE